MAKQEAMRLNSVAHVLKWDDDVRVCALSVLGSPFTPISTQPFPPSNTRPIETGTIQYHPELLQQTFQYPNIPALSHLMVPITESRCVREVF